jgi:hypothetical protein
MDPGKSDGVSPYTIDFEELPRGGMQMEHNGKGP